MDHGRPGSKIASADNASVGVPLRRLVRRHRLGRFNGDYAPLTICIANAAMPVSAFFIAVAFWVSSA